MSSLDDTVVSAPLDGDIQVVPGISAEDPEIEPPPNYEVEESIAASVRSGLHSSHFASDISIGALADFSDLSNSGSDRDSSSSSSSEDSEGKLRVSTMNVEPISEAEILEVSASKEPGIKLDSRSNLELFRGQLPTLNVPSSYINSDPKGRFHCYKIL